MAYTGNTYGDLTPRQANFAVKEFLMRALPLLTIEKFGKQVTLPKNETKTIKMRRYFLTGGTGRDKIFEGIPEEVYAKRVPMRPARTCHNCPHRKSRRSAR